MLLVRVVTSHVKIIFDIGNQIRYNVRDKQLRNIRSELNASVSKQSSIGRPLKTEQSFDKSNV